MSKIPKVIHFCWISNDYPELVVKCMESWKRNLPEYEIKRWDSSNFDFNACQFVKEAYEAKKYAFVSDYVRLYVLYHYGGIYLDTDIEVLRNFDDLLDNSAFTSFENDYSIAAWIFGSEKGNPLFAEFLKYYEERPFKLKDGTYDMAPNPYPLTKICIEHGLVLNNKTQKIENMTVYSMDYFCPYNHISDTLNISENSYCIHYFNGGWFSKKQKTRVRRRQMISKRFGKFASKLYYGCSLLLDEGWGQFIKEVKYYLKKY